MRLFIFFVGGRMKFNLNFHSGSLSELKMVGWLHYHGNYPSELHKSTGSIDYIVIKIVNVDLCCGDISMAKAFGNNCYWKVCIPAHGSPRMTGCVERYGIVDPQLFCPSL